MVDADIVSALKLGNGPYDVFASSLTIDAPNDAPRIPRARASFDLAGVIHESHGQ